MPFIEIKLWKGRSKKQKEDMIREITKATSNTVACPREAVHIAITEYEKDNWGLGGRQASNVENKM